MAENSDRQTEWRPVRDIRVGDKIAGGRKAAIVSAVERSPYGTVRVEYQHGSVVEFRADELFPVCEGDDD